MEQLWRAIVRYIYFALFIALSSSAAYSAELIDRQSAVAKVGIGTITLDQVLELWGPTYYEIISKVKSGKITPSEVNPELQREWKKAIDTVVRDEIFYQEALRSFDKTFQKLVDSHYSAQKSNGVRRKDVEDRLRVLIQRQRDKQSKQVIAGQVAAAGGFDNLAAVLKKRGITYNQWKERIIRKSYTYYFLYSIFQPMGRAVERSPRTIRKYYSANKSEFEIPGRVVFRHILVSNKVKGGADAAYNAAQSIGQAINAGQISFADAAKKYSADKTSSAVGGLEKDISTDPQREAWLYDVREAVRTQKPGELDILESPMGYHITVLEGVGRTAVVPFRSAQKIIQNKMDGADWEKNSDEYYKKLTVLVNTEILMPNFPQQFSWDANSSPMLPRRIGFSADPGVSR